MGNPAQYRHLRHGGCQLHLLLDSQPTVSPTREVMASDCGRAVLGPKRSAGFWLFPRSFFCVLVGLSGTVSHHGPSRSRDAGKAPMAILHLGRLEPHVSEPRLSCRKNCLTAPRSGIFSIARTSELSGTGGVSIYASNYLNAQVLAV